MANKQFRMEKKILETSVCADISLHALKTQYVQLIYEKLIWHVYGMNFSATTIETLPDSFVERPFDILTFL